MKKEAYYFSHDANAMDDPKCMIMIDQLGMEGYGIFWGLIERLRQEKEYKLPTSVLPSLAKRWGTSAEKVQTVVSKYGLFVMEDDGFFSERLRRSMIEKSEKGRKSAEIRWGNATAMQPHSERNAIGMQTDAIKVKESKEKEIIYTGFISVFNKITNKKFKGDQISFDAFFNRTEEGYSLSDFEKAITNCMSDLYHKQNPRYLTPEFITRKDKLETYINAKTQNQEVKEVTHCDFYGKV